MCLRIRSMFVYSVDITSTVFIHSICFWLSRLNRQHLALSQVPTFETTSPDPKEKKSPILWRQKEPGWQNTWQLWLARPTSLSPPFIDDWMQNAPMFTVQYLTTYAAEIFNSGGKNIWSVWIGFKGRTRGVVIRCDVFYVSVSEN